MYNLISCLGVEKLEARKMLPECGRIVGLRV